MYRKPTYQYWGNKHYFNEVWIVVNTRGGGSTLMWTGSAAGVENLTLSQTAQHTKSTPCMSQYTLLKLSYAYPVLVPTDSLFCCVSSYIHKICCVARAPSRRSSRDRGPVINIVVPHAPGRRWCRDRGPVINIVVPHAPDRRCALVPRLRACYKHCGLGTRLQPCYKRSSPPVSQWCRFRYPVSIMDDRENHTLFSGTSPSPSIWKCPPPPPG